MPHAVDEDPGLCSRRHAAAAACCTLDKVQDNAAVPAAKEEVVKPDFVFSPPPVAKVKKMTATKNCRAQLILTRQQKPLFAPRQEYCEKWPQSSAVGTTMNDGFSFSKPQSNSNPAGS